MRLRRPSPATAIASLALFVALGGTALATQNYLITSTTQIKPRVLKQLRGRAGAKGATGAQGKEGAAGKEGATGKEGAAGSARAFAFINDAGDVSHAKGITTANVTTEGGSLYCIGGLSFTPENVVGSAVYPDGLDLVASVELGGAEICPVGTQVTIATYNTSNEVVRGEVEVLIN